MTSEAGRVAQSGEEAARSRLADAIEAAIRAEAGDSGAVRLDLSWSELGLDSFGLVSLRAAAEQALGHEIGDSDWIAAKTPADIIALANGSAAPWPRPAGLALSIEERVEIGMPQMALSGLSEGWLLKNLGHLHWRLIADSLEMKPADISDGEGNRLYPTFTRVRFVSSQPLSAYREGENLLFTARLSRHGQSFMFSTVAVDGDSGRSISAELMSTFAHRGAGGGNAELLRSQPASAHCRAAKLDEMPSFGLVYQERRRDSRAAREVLARAAYDILPQHDINGVGLLYYAAYPLIADICQMRSRGEGPAWAAETSTVERDICYFANADLTAGLEWVLHRDEDGDGLSTDASIVRDDGVVMASVTTRKAAL